MTGEEQNLQSWKTFLKKLTPGDQWIGYARTCYAEFAQRALSGVADPHQQRIAKLIHARLVELGELDGYCDVVRDPKYQEAYDTVMLHKQRHGPKRLKKAILRLTVAATKRKLLGEDTSHVEGALAAYKKLLEKHHSGSP